MAVIESGIDTTVATVDTTTKALHVLPKGVTTTTFNHDDFTLDSFERLRVSTPAVAFEYSFGALVPSSATTIWESTAVGSGTTALTTNLYGAELNTLVGVTTGYWIQSYNHIRYAPGISTLLRFTFNFNELVTNLRQRVGMFTDQGSYPSTAGDGFYLEADGASISVVRRYMTTGGAGGEERVLQSAWNRDKMDGTGASGINLNWALAQHLVVEYQWLGVGTIRFGFETGAGGIVWCHEMISVNVLSTPWSRTGALPVRAEIHTLGALAQPGKLTLINCVVIQEGDVLDTRGWRYFGANSGATAKVGGTAAGLYPVMSLRPASTNDLTKRARILPTFLTLTVAVAATGATSLQVALLMLPTPNTGATFATTVAGSVCTVDTIATATTAVTGSSIANWVIPNIVGQYQFDLSTLNDSMNVIGYNAAGTVSITGSSVLTLAAGPLSGTTTVAATLVASMNWKEIV
jgi:hypothetical protein